MNHVIFLQKIFSDSLLLLELSVNVFSWPARPSMILLLLPHITVCSSPPCALPTQALESLHMVFPHPRTRFPHLVLWPSPACSTGFSGVTDLCSDVASSPKPSVVSGKLSIVTKPGLRASCVLSQPVPGPTEHLLHWAAVAVGCVSLPETELCGSGKAGLFCYCSSALGSA